MPSDSDTGGQAAKLRAILESALDAIITIDSQGIITTANPAAEALFGYAAEEFIGRNIRFLMPDPYRTEHDRYIANYLNTGQRRIIGIGREVSGLKRDGTVFPMHLAVSEFEIAGVRYFTGIIHDLTQSKATERALREAQKMEALGQLTGGIAHDFNNLLTVILGNIEMLESRLSDREQRDLAKEALEAAEAGARLTSRLLAFARRSHLEPEPVNLNQFVLSLTDILHRTLGETIQLSTVLDPSLWPVKVDPSQVESAIVNLAVNARDAMPKGGRLVLETSNARLDADAIAGLQDLPAGDYVRLSVTDTGHGMPQEVRERAFEPFFTTKETGRGTGLGLSMVYGLAKQSGGHATIYSEIDNGTSVNLYLPRSDGGMGTAAGALDDQGAFMGAGERILVVEDDERVRRLTVERLRRLNYRVLDAADAKAALHIIANEPAIDLVFSDLVMPGKMDGRDLARAIATRYPQIRVLLTSGYSEDVVRAAELRATRILRKPYRQTELAEAIAKALI
ncbi:PAS domain S-box protein [Pararhizobium haloflavum]|uniref:PAS domain S-box protein n=1 Tax=Pararhizobium haloflavum TaxID=2037914 RepID=UPI000C184BD2|nr:PAS domain S-box protein [Pararhizobium haloflavum]